MLLTVPPGNTFTASPTLITPEATVPQKPRKSKLGRLTYCTGKRKSEKFLLAVSGADSNISINVGPLYQAARSEGLTTLSPSSADIGTNCTPVIPRFSAKFK